MASPIPTNVFLGTGDGMARLYKWFHGKKNSILLDGSKMLSKDWVVILLWCKSRLFVNLISKKYIFLSSTYSTHKFRLYSTRSGHPDGFNCCNGWSSTN